MQTVLLKIEQKHIDEAIKIRNENTNNCRYCPIALASKELFNTSDVLTDSTCIIVGWDYWLPSTQTDLKKMKDFTGAFDSRKPVLPMELSLEMEGD